MLPDDPRKLFGEAALGDLRALKRAYARLVKTHGPETDPAGFHHVHSRYEAVRARIEAGPEAPVEAAVPAVPVRAPEEWARWLQGGEEPPTIEQLRQELAHAAAGDTAAPVVELAAEAALDPRQTRARLLAALGRPELVPQAFGLCRMAFALDPTLLDEDWHVLGAEVRRLAPGPPFDIARMDALLAQGRVVDAWKAWTEAGPGLLATLPDVAPGRLYELFKRAAWRLKPEQVAVERRRFHEVDVQMPDDLREALDQLAVIVLAVREAAADPAVPPPIVAAVRRILGADGILSDAGILSVIRDLGDARPALVAELERIDRRHPAVGTVFARQLGRISGRYAWMADRARPVSGTVRDAVVALAEELDARRPRRRPCRVAGRSCRRRARSPWWAWPSSRSSGWCPTCGRCGGDSSRLTTSRGGMRSTTADTPTPTGCTTRRRCRPRSARSWWRTPERRWRLPWPPLRRGLCWPECSGSPRAWCTRTSARVGPPPNPMRSRSTHSNSPCAKRPPAWGS